MVASEQSNGDPICILIPSTSWENSYTNKLIVIDFHPRELTSIINRRIFTRLYGKIDVPWLRDVENR